jgi:hypothetical protein
MVCIRNISVDTLHKGNTQDNNNSHTTNMSSKSYGKMKLQILLGSYPVNGLERTLIDRPNMEFAFTAIPLAHNIQIANTENQRNYQDLAF